MINFQVLTEDSLRADGFPGDKRLTLTLSVDCNDLQHVLVVRDQASQGHLCLWCPLSHSKCGPRHDACLDNVVSDRSATVTVRRTPGHIS